MRPARGRARVLRVGLAAFAALGLVIGGSNAWMHLASRGGIRTPEDVPHRPVALVLGAGVQPDGHPNPFLAARLDVAADLLARGKVSLLLVSGDNRTEFYDEPTAMRRYLLSHGVPADRIVMDFAGRDTYDSCVRATRIFGVSGVTLVSQTYHLPRALAVCRAIGLDAVGVGDETMRSYAASVWATGESREIPAAVKAVIDVVSRRDPVLGPSERTVTDRLAQLGETP